jgi:hypothetical protein
MDVYTLRDNLVEIKVRLEYDPEMAKYLLNKLIKEIR